MTRSFNKKDHARGPGSSATVTVEVNKLSWRTRQVTALAFALFATLALCGCNSHQPTVPYSSAPDEPVGEDWLVMQHDFGLLKPSVTVEHRFTIANKSDGPITIREVLNNCSCTASEVSSLTIAARSQEYVTVRYKAGLEASDDSRKVCVFFKEPNAATVALMITAKVRPPMTVEPQEIVLSNIGRGQLPTAAFSIHNFDTAPWTSLALTTSAKWLKTSATLVDSPQPAGTPCQTWRASLAVDTSHISPGTHDALITIANGDGQSLSATIPVRVTVISPVVAIPSQLFFGVVQPHKTMTRTLSLHFADGLVPGSPDEITLTHGLADDLQFTWRATDSKAWTLEAALTSTESNRAISADVVLSFRNKSLPSISIPLLAQTGEAME